MNSKNVVPNTSTSEVTVKNNQIIYTSINNNLQKLTDNDLFIERQLKKDDIYQIGPKKFNESDISSAIDGYKCWNENIRSLESLSILHKSVYELSNSIIDTPIISTEINFICDISKEIIVGTKNGLYGIQTGGKILNESLGAHNIKQCFSDITKDIILLTTDKGVYEISCDNSLQWTCKDIIQTNNCDNVFIDSDNYVYISNEDGLSFCEYKSSDDYIFKPYRKNTFDLLDEKLISLNEVDDNKFFITNNNIYTKIKYNSFSNIYKIKIDEDIEINDIIEYTNKVYVLTTKGLYYIEENEYGENVAIEVDNCKADCSIPYIYEKKLYVIGDNKLYVLDDDNKLVLIKEFEGSSTSIISFSIYDDTYFIFFENIIQYKDIDEEIMEWNSLQINNKNDKIVSQYFNGNAIIICVQNEKDNLFSLYEINKYNKKIEKLVNHKIENLSFNKIVKHNSGDYILTNQGLYKNHIANESKLFDGNIIDLCFYNQNYVLVFKDINNNNYIVWGDINNIKNQDGWKCQQSTTNIDSISYCLDKLFIVSDKKLFYSTNFEFENSGFAIEKIESKLNISKIQAFEDKLYILTTEKSIYTIKTIIESTINEQNWSSEEMLNVKGVSYSHSSLDKERILLFSEDKIFENKTRVDDSEEENTIEYVDIKTGLTGIQDVVAYDYYYSTIDERLFDESCDFNEILSNSVFDEEIHNPKLLSALSNQIEIDLKFPSFTKDVYMVIDNTHNFNVYEYTLNDETNEPLFKNLHTESFENDDIIKIFQMCDYNKLSDDSNIEDVEKVYTMIFLSSGIKIGKFTNDGEEWLDSFDYTNGYEISGETYYNVHINLKEYSYNYRVENIDNDILFNFIDTGERIQYITNVSNLKKKNLLFYVTKKDNKQTIRYFIQDNNLSLIDNFRKADQFDDIDISDSLSDGQKITDIAASYITEDEYGTYIDLYIKIDNDIYITKKLKISYGNGIEKNEEIKRVINTDNNFNIFGYYGDVILLPESIEPTPKYFTFHDTQKYIIDTNNEIGNNVDNIKVENDKFYKIYSDKVLVYNNSITNEPQTISCDDVYDIFYNSNKYYLMKKTKGVYISLSDGNLNEQSLFKNHKIKGFSNDKYFYDGGFYDITYLNINEININLKEISSGTTEYKKFIIKNKQILFIDQENNLNILNSDYTSTPFTVKENNLVKHTVKRLTDNLIICDGKILTIGENKNVWQEVLSKTNDSKPTIEKEVQKFFIRNDDRYCLYKYDEIKENDYVSHKMDITDFNFNKIYQNEKDNIMMICGNQIYYYKPLYNTLYLKYVNSHSTDNIKDVLKDNNIYTLVIGNNLYQIDNNFKYINQQLLLNLEGLKCVHKINEYEYLLGTAKNLLKTEYRYKIENDIPLCSLSLLDDRITSEFNDNLSNHISAYHSVNSIITKVNKQIMPIDCENLDGIKNNYDISNYIKTIEFGDTVQHISAYVSFGDNENQQTLLSSVFYINKDYAMTDESELMIYVPTTNTNYINHVSDILNDTSKTTHIYRKNISEITSRNVNENKTILTICIDKGYFDINNIVSFEINGNSLPLKIYIDNDNKHLFKNKLFSSIVKKSMLKSLSYNENDDIIKIQFLIFGTDAQAIRLTTYRNIRYTIRYHYYYGVESKSYIVDSEYDVPFNDQIENGKIFKGWSTIENSNTIDFEYGGVITKDKTWRDTIIDVYPVYEDYIFDTSKSTILRLTPSQGDIYINGTQIEDSQTIIDYDYKGSI